MVSMRNRRLLDDVPPTATTVLNFSSDLITNATLTPRGNATDVRHAVEMHTAGLAGIQIKLVTRESERVLATIRRRKVLPDQITFEGKRPTRLSRWLKWPRRKLLCVTFSLSLSLPLTCYEPEISVRSRLQTTVRPTLGTTSTVTASR
ncbi:hypothetical protein J3R83DRAFT_1580 [Lanmaoa asiatica]|nr:hypothetical protein J3R83DRAFT_1580 [Lanmaoa asiatica]